MKAKYQIGMMVKTGENTFGEVEGVMETLSGYTYKVNGGLIEEASVLKAYVPLGMKLRKRKAPTELQEERGEN